MSVYQYSQHEHVCVTVQSASTSMCNSTVSISPHNSSQDMIHGNHIEHQVASIRRYSFGGGSSSSSSSSSSSLKKEFGAADVLTLRLNGQQ